MNSFSILRTRRRIIIKNKFPFLCRIGCVLVIVLLLSAGVTQSALAELTKAQAIARVRAILRNNTSGCQINKISSVTAVRVKAGWRVTARITMSASGSRRAETAVWIVSAKNGTSAQNQLSAEIENGCP